jgi:hypothetical protein
LETIHFDFKKHHDWHQYEDLCNRIKDLTKEKELSMLINNVNEYDA